MNMICQSEATCAVVAQNTTEGYSIPKTCRKSMMRQEKCLCQSERIGAAKDNRAVCHVERPSQYMLQV